MSEQREVLLGRPGGDHLAVRVTGRRRPDDDWLDTVVSARVGGFTAECAAALRTDELRAFRNSLEQLRQDLRGEAVLVSMEEWLSVTVVCQPNGSLTVTGEITDSGNTLTVTLTGLDQTDVPGALAALTTISREYPTVGQQP